MLGHSNNDSGSGINRDPGADAPDVISSYGVERSYTPAEIVSSVVTDSGSALESLWPLRYGSPICDDG